MMHNANFVDNRLRLTAFLRVVEEGMPQRPSRFTRRSRVANKTAGFSVATSPPHTNQVVPAPDAHQGLSIQGSASPNAISIAAAVENEGTIDTEFGQFEENETENRAQSSSIYDIPLSPIPTETRSSPASGDNQAALERQSPGRRQQDSNPSAKFRQKARTAVLVKAKKASGKPLGSSSTRKRRLPVNELALLRTTTSDGLPQPGDTDAVFATPITVVDPIEDSQIPKSLDPVTSSIQRSHNLVISKRRLSPRMAQQPNLDSSFRNRLFKSPTKRKQERLTSSRLFPQSWSGMQFADGFVDHELNSASRKGHTRRSKTVSARRKKPVVRELALGSGPLPVSETENAGLLMAHANDNSLCLDHLHTTSGLKEHQNKTKPGQLVLTRSQSVALSERSRVCRPKQCDKAILHQLSSITAPLRRESGSSDSDIVEEEGKMDSEDGNDTDSDNEVDDYNARYILSTQVPTFADDTSYFQTAMQQLEVGRLIENGEDDFWSQYGPMD